ncbi:lipase 1-like [Galleria mellonella]|uniref:Lipase n=1 Tax=Galleria mellonella TaxID=7137 RepID=A0A6J1WJA5_GALME|nr:lipase 1-like [Galleria mellonella]
MFKFLLFAVLATVALARRSPHADYIEELYKQNEGRYSSNVIEDALLDVPGLLLKYGYPIEIHKVITEDNYVLEAHRIPHGRGQLYDPNRPIVFVMHGLLSSSADFLVLGPGSGLGYILADAGYDVWLGNARGSYYSRQHLYLNPDQLGNADFWKFTYDEIGNIDLPSFIDYILDVTGKTQLHYIGHSQGCTTFLILNSLRPEYNEKFLSFQALAPAAYFIYNDFDFFKFAAPYEAPVTYINYNYLGLGEFLGNREALTWVAVNLCNEDGPIYRICQKIMSLESVGHVNTTITPIILGHTPAGASIRQLAHFGQAVNTKLFRRYSHRPIENIELYGSPVPPAYDVSQVTVPVHLYHGLGDYVTNSSDILYLAQQLNNVIGVKEVERPSFTHFDFIWGIDAKELVYDDVVAVLDEVEANKK